MKKLTKLSMAALLVIGLLASLVGCGSTKTETSPESGSTAPAQKKLVFASDTAYAPFEYQDAKTGQYVGFDMDLIKEVCKVAGYQYEIRSMGFDGALAAVTSKQVDGAISAMTITEKRKKQFNFSDPYFDSDQSIAVLTKDNTIKSEADLKGKRIAVQIGTTGAIYARSIAGTTVKDFNTIDLAFLELKNGNADAVINDFPVTDNYIKSGNPDIKVVKQVKTGEQYGIAFNKDNTEVLTKINAALKTIKENGTYDQIYKKWFGKLPLK